MFNIDVSFNLAWAVIGILLALGLIAFIQFVYVSYLSASGSIDENANRPNRPVMPTRSSGWSSDNLSEPLGSIIEQISRGHSTPSGITDHGATGKFVVMTGLAQNRELRLPGGEFGIGRFMNPEHNIIMNIDEKSISRQHATFAADEALREYYLTDTSSTYGTYLMQGGRSEKLPPNTPVRVYNEDVVQFGSKVRVRLVLPTETREEAIR